MAKKIEIPDLEPDPLATLTTEARQHIENLETEIRRVEGDLDAMDELGLETSILRERVEWAKKARKIILDRFT